MEGGFEWAYPVLCYEQNGIVGVHSLSLSVSSRSLFYRDGLGKVAGLVYIAAFDHRNMVC